MAGDDRQYASRPWLTRPSASTCATQLAGRSATACATQLRRACGHGGRRRSTSTRASPTRARSPPSGARSTRSPASSRETLQDIEDALAKFDAGTYGDVRVLRPARSPRPASRRCRRPGSASPARRSAAEPRHASVNTDLAAGAHLLRLPGRRGHPPRDQPRRRRARGSATTPPREAGRLTLNPIPHIDPFGSIILPAMGALSGFPVLAWAKPVPVNPNRLRNPRRDMLFVEPRRARHELRC